MKIVQWFFASFCIFIGCVAPSPIPGPRGEPGPQGPMGAPGVMGSPGSCQCAPTSQVFERTVTLDAKEFQVQDTQATIEKIAAADWPKGARMTGLWIVPVSKFGLTTSQLYMSVGTPAAPALFAGMVPISPFEPTIAGFEGVGFGPSRGAGLVDPLVLTIASDNLPLIGSVGQLELHVVVETPATF
jgi:hypothetical protein